MSFKLKGAPYDKDNMNIAVYRKDLTDGSAGKSNHTGIIVDKDVSPKMEKAVIAHEKVHQEQQRKGELDYDENNFYWKGKVYPRENLNEHNENLPWEKEAYKVSNSMLKDKTNDMKQRFQLKGYRGNNKPFAAMSNKGLIGPEEGASINIGERRKVRKSKADKPKKIRSRKPIKAKYASTQYTEKSKPTVYQGGESVEGSITTGSQGGESKHTKRTFIKDLTGKLFKTKEETTTKKIEGKGSTTRSTGKDETLDKGRKIPTKTAGTKVNEVYKMRKMGKNEKTGKDMIDLDIKRRVTRSNPANTIKLDNYQKDPSKQRITETDYGRKMQVQKFRGPHGLKSKTKSYISKADMGGTRSFELQGGNRNVNDPKAKQYKQVGQTSVTKKQARAEGYKPISDKRFDRIAKRQSNFGQRRMAQGIDQAAGGLHGNKQSYESGSQSKRSFKESADRLFKGEGKRADMYVSREGRKRKRKANRA